MRYMLLIYADESKRDDSPEVMEQWNKYTEDLQATGLMLGGDALQPIATATTVRVREGETLTTDGPFAETKEQLGGYYMLDCNAEQAANWAAKMPAAPRGSVEIRPIREFD
jgi:hypothetical protein